MALKNGVLTSRAALGVAGKWRHDVEFAAFLPIRWATANNGGGLWFYAYGALQPRQSDISQGDWFTVAEILQYLAVPQVGAPIGVFILPEVTTRRGYRWIQFPLTPSLETRVEEARLSQAKGRVKAKLVNWTMDEVIDPRRLIRR